MPETTHIGSARASYLDASVLVKYFIEEERNYALIDFQEKYSTCFTTHSCFYHAIGILKIKCQYRKGMSMLKYKDALHELAKAIAQKSICIDDEIDITNKEIFTAVVKLAQKHDLDMATAIQLFSLKVGCFTRFEGNTWPILATADNQIALVGRKEGLEVWNCRTDPIP